MDEQHSWETRRRRRMVNPRDIAGEREEEEVLTLSYTTGPANDLHCTVPSRSPVTPQDDCSGRAGVYGCWSNLSSNQAGAGSGLISPPQVFACLSLAPWWLKNGIRSAVCACHGRRSFVTGMRECGRPKSKQICSGRPRLAEIGHPVQKTGRHARVVVRDLNSSAVSLRLVFELCAIILTKPCVCEGKIRPRLRSKKT